MGFKPPQASTVSYFPSLNLHHPSLFRRSVGLWKQLTVITKPGPQVRQQFTWQLRWAQMKQDINTTFLIVFHIEAFEKMSNKRSYRMIIFIGTFVCMPTLCILHPKTPLKHLNQNIKGTGTWTGTSILPYQAPLIENLFNCILYLLPMHYCLFVFRTAFHSVLNRKI